MFNSSFIRKMPALSSLHVSSSVNQKYILSRLHLQIFITIPGVIPNLYLHKRGKKNLKYSMKHVKHNAKDKIKKRKKTEISFSIELK